MVFNILTMFGMVMQLLKKRMNLWKGFFLKKDKKNLAMSLDTKWEYEFKLATY